MITFPVGIQIYYLSLNNFVMFPNCGGGEAVPVHLTDFTHMTQNVIAELVLPCPSQALQPWIGSTILNVWILLINSVIMMLPSKHRFHKLPLANPDTPHARHSHHRWSTTSADLADLNFSCGNHVELLSSWLISNLQQR